MKTRTSDLLPVALIILATLALIGLTLTNLHYSRISPGGNDFIPRWLGTRLFIMEGQSPYSQETTQEIQQMIYGRLARSGEDQVMFVYPFYSIYIFAPFALIADFAIARAVWMTTLEISVILIMLISLLLSRWRLNIVMLVVLLIFSILWYHTVRPLINGNAAILVAIFVTAMFLAIRAEQDGLAGFLLALSTIKPQMVILLVLFVLLWCISKKRWLVFWSFWGSLALLIASTTLVLPDSILQNLRQVVAYPGYTLSGTPGEILSKWVPGVGRELGWALTFLLGGILILEWRAAWGKDFRWFLWTACLTLVITNLVGIRTTTANYIALLPTLVLILANWDQNWGIIGRGLVVFTILLLFFGLWWLFLSTLELGDQPIQHPVMFFPLPILTLTGLYWIRWWALQPRRPLLEQLRCSQSQDFRY